MVYMLKARSLVFEYANKNIYDAAYEGHPTDFSIDDVYIVWFNKTLQNFKAMLGTNIPDGMYYEVTYNGDRDEFYLDPYKKLENICIPGHQFERNYHE